MVAALTILGDRIAGDHRGPLGECSTLPVTEARAQAGGVDQLRGDEAARAGEPPVTLQLLVNGAEEAPSA